MNKITVVACLLLSALTGAAQTYTFESNYSHWTASQGTLALSTDHYKEGTHSLEWTTQGKAQMIVSGFAAYTANTNSCFMQVYLPEATGDELKVEFLNGTSVKRTAVFVCNYQGWREFSRLYSEYASTSSTTINALRFTLTPTDLNATRKIYFDDVRLNTTADGARVPGTQWVKDCNYLKVNTASVLLAANPVD